MTITRWKIAAAIVLFAALGYRLFASFGQANRPDETAIIAKEDAGPQASPGEPNEQAADLLDRIDDGKKRMKAAGSRFGATVRDAMTAQQVDREGLQQSLEMTLAVIRSVRRDAIDGGEPTFASGQALALEYIKYCNWQEKIYLEDYAALVNDLSDPCTSPLERQNIVKTVFAERGQNAQGRDAKLDALRQALFEDFGVE